jgi:ABC-type antimicrobial peptide transport system permease subunit
LVGGILGAAGAYCLIYLFSHSPQAAGFFTIMKVTPATMVVAMTVAAIVGFLSAVVPSYHASQVNIVEGLRHIG